MQKSRRFTVIKSRIFLFGLSCLIAVALLATLVLRRVEAAPFAAGNAVPVAEAAGAAGADDDNEHGRRFSENILGQYLFGMGGTSPALFASPLFQSSGARSLSLGGGSRVDVPSSASLNITGPVTVEAWIKTTTTADQAIIERYATYPGAGVSNGGYVLRLMGGRVTFSTLRNSNEFDYVQGATAVTTGVWHHVAGVFDGAQLRVYLDGALDGSKASTFAPATGTAPVRIGAKGDDTTIPFSGLVDEARVSAAALYGVNFTPATNLTPINGVRGLWKFDDQAAGDSSGNSNHGTLVASASFSTETCDNTPPAPDNSLSLGGGAKAQVPSSTSLNITGPVTVEAWVKTNSTADQAIVERYATYPGAGVSNGGYVLRIMGGRATFSTLRNSNEFDYQQGATLVSVGVWHHVAGVFDGAQLRVYLDGALDGSKASTFAPATGTAPVRIGAKGDDQTLPFNGLIDEARVSAGALYGVNFTPATRLSAVTNVRGLWKFDSQTANDSSGNSNHGTLLGGASFSADTPHHVSNTPPIANAGGPYSVTAATNLQFNGSASYDADGAIANYAWNFGDGQSGTGVSPTHAYAANGSYTVTLAVTDNSGLVGSATTSVTVGPSPPAAPSALTATAASANQVNLAWADNSSNETGFKIERKTGAAGAYAEIATVGAGVTSYGNTGLTSNTQYFYRVRATSAGGDSAYSNEAGATTQNQPPTVSLTAPTTGSSYTAPAGITLTATAADADGGVAKVEFYQGATKLGEDLTSPYGYVWSNVPAGSYSLTARAIDVNGAQATSAAAAVTVTLPAVTVSATDANASEQGPDAGAFTISRTGATGAALTVNYTVGGTATGGADYASVGTSVTIPAGASSQVVTVTPVNDSAVESNGETIILTLSNNAAYTVGSPSSAAVTIADNDTYPPSASITSPAGGTVFTAPASISINATAADADGSVVKVEFFQGATKLGEDTTAPYSFSWVNPAAGSYNLTARATDNASATGTSAAVSVVVNTPPSVSVTGPANNSTVSAGASGQVTAAASDPDQGDSVAKVEFYDGATKLGEDTTSPYGFTWQNVPEGTHLLTAVATDARGASATSAPVSVSAVNFDMARLDASNRTGGSGVDLVSRNFNWSLPLVSLPGRAGLDPGLSLTYNSLVWTKSGNSVLFDGDGGWPAPGFRLGFAVVRGKFYDSQAQKYAYMLITPAGARVSLRQTSTPGVYEAGDSSYLQLTEESNGTLTLRSTDGTRMNYWPLGGVYKCTEIKDRNGNFITVAYDSFGNLQTVTDTLGRVITFVYADGHLDEITQTWHREVESGSTTQVVTETHRWAKFSYENKAVQTNFAGLNVLGPETFHALTKVTLADDSSVTFNYTTWGQVNQVAAYAADNRLLNYVSLDLPVDATTAQTDCPRPTQRRNWAAYRNGDVNGAGAASEEAVTSYGPYDFASGVAKAEAPDGTLHKETYETSGWRKGLTTRADEFSADDDVHPKKWTVLTWTQDDESLPYEKNPRVRETNIYDSREDGTDNPRDRRRTEVVYTSFGLVQDVKEYDSTATVVMRRTHTEYVAASVNAGGAYAQRRIIGLPEKREVFGLEGGQERRFSKVTFEYDLPPNGGTLYLVDAGGVAQHDAAYGASFTTRGNVCLSRRWDAQYPDDASKSVLSEVGYDTNGSTVFTSDALGRRTNISYAGPNGAGGLAYPTKVTDPDNFFSTVEYNYDTGAMTRSVDPKGAAAKSFYDSVGRRLKVKSEVNGAYTRWEYGASGLYLKEFTTVDAGLAETFVMSVTDGAGRVRGSLRELPGSVGGYSAQQFGYDNVGQVVRRYNPTEVTVNAANQADIGGWQPAGDDAAAGWKWAEQTYDWKGRPLVTTNAADGTTVEYSYGGCGCAGGDTVLTRDEVGRRQKVTRDVLGRVVKVEVLDIQSKSEELSDAGQVYTTTITAYNSLDQVSMAKQYQGDESSSVFEEALTTYDGHGRPATSKSAIQSRPTSYAYNADDSIWKVFTPREAAGQSPQDVTATFTYNGRGLVTHVEYSVPQGLTSVPVTAPVDFTYDEGGNRLSMTDGLGRTDYAYDGLSRLLSETRYIAATNKSYPLHYTYNLAGELSSITNPSGAVTNYQYDQVGQLKGVTGTNFSDVSQYASGMQYRAWGDLKEMTYGNTKKLSVTYDNRLRMTGLDVPGVMSKSYEYYGDGRLKFADDHINDIFDRSYSFDLAGRITQALTGTEARGGATADGPYNQTYTYDAFGHLTARNSRHWSHTYGHTSTYLNGRNNNFQYDAAGNPTQRGSRQQFTYDAAGRQTRMHDPQWGTVRTPSGGVALIPLTVTSDYDGDGQLLRQQGRFDTTYFIRSSVLGKVVSEVTIFLTSAEQRVSNVYAGSQLIAKQTEMVNGTQGVVWVHREPGGAERRTGRPGNVTGGKEFDPAGADNEMSDPYPTASGDGGAEFAPTYPSHASNPTDTMTGCSWNGIPMECGQIFAALSVTVTGGGNGVMSYEWVDQWKEFQRIDSRGSAVLDDNGNPVLQGAQVSIVATNIGRFIAVGAARSGVRLATPFVHVQYVLPTKPITSLMSDLLKKGGCAEYVQRLLDKANELFAGKLPHVNTIYEAMEKISQQGGYQLNSHGIHTVDGDLFYREGGYNRLATVNLIPFKSRGTPTAEAVAHAQYVYAISGLHESFHLARQAGYNDELMARAAYALNGKTLPTIDPRLDEFGVAGTYSSLWDTELMKHCREEVETLP